MGLGISYTHVSHKHLLGLLSVYTIYTGQKYYPPNTNQWLLTSTSKVLGNTHNQYPHYLVEDTHKHTLQGMPSVM